MSTQVQNIINSALTLIGVIAAGESPAPEESTDALLVLNDLITSWDVERLVIYATNRATYNLIISQQTYTIGQGAGANFNAARPTSIWAANIINSAGLAFPMKLVTKEEWASIPEKSVTGAVPRELWNDNGYPNSTLYLWPIPSAGSTQLELYTWQQLTTFVNLTDTFDFPPGYERAIRFNLAVELASEYGREIPQTVGQIAMDSKNAIRGLNAPPVSGMAEEGAARSQAAQGMQAPPAQPVPPLTR